MNDQPISLEGRADVNDPAFFPFRPGQEYVVKSDFIKGSTHFQQGIRLRFRVSGYSHYDNAFAYEFESVATGETLTWWLWSNEPSDLWQSLFIEG